MGFLLISRDISDEIRLTQELKAAQSYARSLIEASLDPFFTISPEGKITDLNEAAVQVTGLGREQLLGTDFADYFTDSKKARKGQQKEVLSQGFIHDYPLAICHVVGWVTDVLFSASVYKDEKGTVRGVFAAFRGVTERKMAKKATRTSSAYARNWSQSRSEMIEASTLDG
jgi:PAS domain S-box-containing protein